MIPSDGIAIPRIPHPKRAAKTGMPVIIIGGTTYPARRIASK